MIKQIMRFWPWALASVVLVLLPFGIWKAILACGLGVEQFFNFLGVYFSLLGSAAFAYFNTRYQMRNETEKQAKEQLERRLPYFVTSGEVRYNDHLLTDDNNVSNEANVDYRLDFSFSTLLGESLPIYKARFIALDGHKNIVLKKELSHVRADTIVRVKGETLRVTLDSHAEHLAEIDISCELIQGIKIFYQTSDPSEIGEHWYKLPEKNWKKYGGLTAPRSRDASQWSAETFDGAWK